MNSWIVDLNKGDKVLVENRESGSPIVEVSTVDSVLAVDGVFDRVFVSTDNPDVLLEFLPNEPTWSHRIMPFPAKLNGFLQAVS
jgi:hypothetical protein